MKIKITELKDGVDSRGSSFSLPQPALEFIGTVCDLHLACTLTGSIRGNHFHLRKREAIMILPGAAWSLHWDEGNATQIEHRNFDGTAAVLVLVEPGCSHAVRNDGHSPMWLVACSSEKYDPAETVARKVI